MTIPFDHHVFVCTNRRTDGHPRGSCAARGSEALRDALKAVVKEAGISGVRINGHGGVFARVHTKDRYSILIVLM